MTQSTNTIQTTDNAEENEVSMHVVDFLTSNINDMDYHDLQQIVNQYFAEHHSVRSHPTDPSQVLVDVG